jgi:hypothetical protein
MSSYEKRQAERRSGARAPVRRSDGATGRESRPGPSAYERRTYPNAERPEEERFVAVWDGTRWVQKPVWQSLGSFRPFGGVSGDGG